MRGLWISRRPAPAPKPKEQPVKPVKEDASALPGPDVDKQLDDEIAAALDGVDLMAMVDEAESAGAEKAAGEQINGMQLRKGRVIGLADDGAFVELGGKSQGFLPADEFDEGQKPQVGDTLDVAILRYDARDGLLILSKRTADKQLLIRDLTEGARVEARVTGSNKGGLELDIKGLAAFMPASQIDIGRVEDFDQFIGERWVCEVTQAERGDKNIVVSRRNVIEAERAEEAEATWGELDKGQLRHGVVRSIMDYGAFVDIGGVDGLLHVREMSWSRVKHPADILSVGMEVDVVVTEVDREKKRIGLSLRQAGGDPWSTVGQKYPVGSRHQAQIMNLADFGAFAQLEPGIEGLIPIGQMTWAGRIKHPSDVVQVGQMVEVEILNVDPVKQRIGLSMKSMQENPWSDIELKYAPDQICTGTVARTTDFGAFVTLEPGVDGLVHISQLADHHVKSVSEVVQAGQDVTVKVLSVDPGAQRIGLTIKGVQEQAPTKDADDKTPAVDVSAIMVDDTSKAGSGSTGMISVGGDAVKSEKSGPAKKKKKKEVKRRGGLSF